MTALRARLARTAASLKTAGGDWRAPIGLVLGSGLGALAEKAGDGPGLAYSAIDGLTAATAPGHAGRLRAGVIAGTRVAICEGRIHLYEGASALDVAMPVYMLHSLGVRTLIVTNAAGGLNPGYAPGEIMAISDHINLTGANPTLGEETPEIGPRFVDMSQAYDRALRAAARAVAQEAGIVLREGVYAGVLGPSLETSAERRSFHQMGADAVGMSTVLEVIAANHCGMKVLGLSAITNKADGGPDQQPDTIEEVLAHARVAGEKISALIERLAPQIAEAQA